ncbi:MAG: glutamate--tRNA ligase [Candidatus Falkowbacteria bacterium]|nr:glutamate--tRNA ligase [Candidatus Falkowbacteria bacterium]
MFSFLFGHKNTKPRLRFAPSPTGFLHIGSLRAALFGYLLAKSQGGDLILRIEDTDQKREVTGATESLIKVLKIMGLEFDEGPHLGGKYGPYIQTQRLDIYHEYSDKLLAEGKVYRCFCSEERLTEMREAQEAKKEAPRYDRLCRDLSVAEAEAKIKAGEKFVIRQKMPLNGEVKVYDELRGEIIFKAADLDDHVLIKSAGIPTYQFANVVDDHLMEITQVTRGDEWLGSFPKNILLYRDFGWTPPKFIHMPLILNKVGGGKLSKRKGDVFVEDYLAKGYLPEALINFCVLLGWHPKSDQEIWTLAELKKEFSLAGMGASPAIFDTAKLDYYNSYYLRQKSVAELTKLCLPYLVKAGRDIGDLKRTEKFTALAQDRLKTLSEIGATTDFLFELPAYAPELLRWKILTLEEAKINLARLKSELEKINEGNWTKDRLEKTILTWIKGIGGQNGDYLWPLRVALTGLKNSPSPFEVADALGRGESLRRLNLA